MDKPGKSNPDSVFASHGKADTDSVVTVSVVNEARKTGILKLSGRGLRCVPEKVWTIGVLDDSELENLKVQICDEDDEPKWWEFTELTTLLLDNNSITEVSPKIKCLESLITLNLESNGIKTIPKEINCLHKLKDLNVKKNKIKHLCDELFCLTSLIKLMAAYNELESVSPDISNLTMLQELDLSHNKLKELPMGIGFLTHLTNCDFSYNELSKIPPDLVNLLFLKQLKIANNKIVELPALGELRRLQILSAEDNLLSEIPDLNGCESLKEINFANNSICVVLVSTLETLTRVSSLNLEGNQIKELPEHVSMLRKIERLNISNNRLEDLPKMLGSLPHLTQLQLDGNPFGAIRSDILQHGPAYILRWLRQKESEKLNPEIMVEQNIPNPEELPDRYKMQASRALHIAKLQLTGIPQQTLSDALTANVTSVDISRNKFAEIPERLSMLCEKVSELNCGYNILKFVPPFLGNFKALMYLNLQNNILEELPEDLGNLKSLRELVISCNRFKALPTCIYSMKSLQILIANTNSLESLDIDSLSNLGQLATLDLANNNINYIPPTLGNMKQLRNLQLEGNSFRLPRQDILMKGTEAILAYLRDKIPRH